MFQDDKTQQQHKDSPRRNQNVSNSLRRWHYFVLLF